MPTVPLLKKLIAAPFTPMHEDGEINYEVIAKYVDVLLEQGVTNVFVNGTTGEGINLNLEERKKIVEKWIEVGKGKMDKIVVQVGSACLKDSQELARHAQVAGADYISCLSPFYFRPATIKLLVDYLAEVARCAPDLPFLYYHIPSMTGVEFQMFHLMNEAVERIPNFAGMKFTSFDLVDLGRCGDKYGQTYNLCYSKDEQFAMGLMLGARAGVGSTYNYAGRIYTRIYDAAMKGDFVTAAKHQIVSQKMVSVFFDEGFDMGTHKAIMQKITGLQMGPPRLPFEKPAEEKIERIMKKLEEFQFLELRK